MEKALYIAEFDNDIDDAVAAHWLLEKRRLGAILADPTPITEEGLQRLSWLSHMGAEITEDIPASAPLVIVGGRLSKLAKNIAHGGHIGLMVANGGFAGKGFVNPADALPKFFKRDLVRTFNFNLDAHAADAVLRSSSEQIEDIVLVSKNVCHSPINTLEGLWNDNLCRDIARHWNVDSKKRLHDLLACHEALSLADSAPDKLFCRYRQGFPFNDGLNADMTKWGTQENPSAYRQVRISVGFSQHGTSTLNGLPT